MKRTISTIFFSLLLGAFVVAWIFSDQISLALRSYLPRASDAVNASTGADENGTENADAVHGPHGGRLLVQGAFGIEITIAELGHPPEFRVYAYAGEKPVAPALVNLDIELARLGGTVDHFSFTAVEDYLHGSGVVSEPHSFDVTVAANYQGQAYAWSYENHEGRVHIAEAQAQQAEVATEIAGPMTIHETVILTGRVQTDPNRMSRVLARFPGVVKSVRRNLGEVVRAGDVLATVQSNESLQTYSLKAPIGGLIVRRDVQIGESTANEPLFEIADLSSVWVELDVFGRDLLRVQADQSVAIETFDGYKAAGKIDWISPLAAHASQSVRARIPLPNPDGRLRPGQFVRGLVTIAEHHVQLAVRKSAVQRFRDFQVVFARFGETYEVRMIDMGRSDNEWVEVLAGLTPGTDYVTSNSYLIKADIDKSGASHDH
jgi:cobalt-zinc-cadmium efflux system membrane fusion protein